MYNKFVKNGLSLDKTLLQVANNDVHYLDRIVYVFDDFMTMDDLAAFTL
jgi:hypothetical protein